jgi:hypothetical protein
MIQLVVFLVLCMGTVWAQEEKPALPKEARQFDFWIGEWDLTLEGGTGHNTISAILDSAVIQEEFVGGDFKGKSVSVYNRHTLKWQQTWVDNAGGYLDFVGGFEGGKMVLARTAERDGVRFLQRMVWYNIERDQLDWNWERSDDAGKTWKVLWQIHYVRKKQ